MQEPQRVLRNNQCLCGKDLTAEMVLRDPNITCPLDLRWKVDLLASSLHRLAKPDVFQIYGQARLLILGSKILQLCYESDFLENILLQRPDFSSNDIKTLQTWFAAVYRRLEEQRKSQPNN